MNRLLSQKVVISGARNPSNRWKVRPTGTARGGAEPVNRIGLRADPAVFDQIAEGRFAVAAAAEAVAAPGPDVATLRDWQRTSRGASAPSGLPTPRLGRHDRNALVAFCRPLATQRAMRYASAWWVARNRRRSACCPLTRATPAC